MARQGQADQCALLPDADPRRTARAGAGRGKRALPVLLGDIALAGETCAREAADKGVPIEHHAAHLIVHGLLHLAGYDHETSPGDAAIMEELETMALASMGIADPYGPIDWTSGAGNENGR